MKTDSIFYQIFLQFPQSFFDLVGEPEGRGENYQFTSREVKQLSFRLDGLFLPRSSELPLYLLEVQFQPDEELYYRVFAEFFLFLRQYKPPNSWRIVIIYPGRRVEREPAPPFQQLLANVSRIYLDELDSDSGDSLGVSFIKLVVESEERAVAAARSLIERTQNQLSDSQLRRNLLQLIESIVVYKFPRKSREEIEAMFNLSDLKQTRVYQEALAEGREQGIEQGITIGKREGEASLILRLLDRRLGAISPSVGESIRSLSIERLESLAEALLDFNAEEDLRSWLRDNG